MTDTMDDKFEPAVLRSARAFGYPKAPNVAPAVRSALQPRRFPDGLSVVRTAALLAVFFAAVLLSVPQARALIAGWFRIGVIKIVPDAPVEAFSGRSPLKTESLLKRAGLMQRRNILNPGWAARDLAHGLFIQKI